MYGQPENNPNNLRVIRTARTRAAINAGAKEGFHPLVKPVEPGAEVQNRVIVYQHRKTGEIELVGDCRMMMSEEYKCVIRYHAFYPYSFPEPIAAYLVPPDLKEGERVWLEDIIEDMVAVFGNQGWHPRLESFEAIWTKGEFKIQFDPEKDAPRLIG